MGPWARSGGGPACNWGRIWLSKSQLAMPGRVGNKFNEWEDAMKWIKHWALALSVASMPAWAETGVEATSVRFGSTMDISGPNGANVSELVAGISLAFDEANAQGGVNGRSVSIVFADDVFLKDRAIANTRDLNDTKKVFALIGGTGSGIVPAVMPVLTELRIPMVGAYAGGMALRESTNRYFFNTRASYDDEASAIVSHITQSGLKELSIVYADDGFGKAVLASFRRAAKASGATLVVEAPIGADFNGEAANELVKNLNPNIPVVLGGGPKHALGFVPEFRKKHLNTIYSISTIGNIFNTLGKDSVGMVVSQAMPPVLNTETRIVADYQAAVDKSPNKKLKTSMPGLEGYVQARIALEGLRMAGQNPTRESFVDALEGFTAKNIGGFYVTYAKDRPHLGTSFVEMIMIGANGSMVF